MLSGSKASDLLYFAMAWRVNDLHEDCVDITYIPVYCSNHTSEEIEVYFLELVIIPLPGIFNLQVLLPFGMSLIMFRRKTE